MTASYSRTTHAWDGDLVVFHIGMVFRKPHRPDLWLPVFTAMPRMLAELERNKAAAARGEVADPEEATRAEGGTGVDGPAVHELLGRMPAPVAVVHGPDHRVAYVNAAYAAAFGTRVAGVRVRRHRDPGVEPPDLHRQAVLPHADQPMHPRSSDRSEGDTIRPCPSTWIRLLPVLPGTAGTPSSCGSPSGGGRSRRCSGPRCSSPCWR